MTPFDPRRTPARPDLAASHLRGKVDAEHFVDGQTYRIDDGHAPIRREAACGAALDTEALFGESFIAYEERDGWLWGQLQSDSYVGWLPRDATSQDAVEPDHRVAVPQAFVFPEADIKQPPRARLPLGARVAVSGTGTGKGTRQVFARIATGGFVIAAHLAPLGRPATDWVSVAETLLHAPYLWGGRTVSGLDCSALVQLALDAAGVVAPRDSDMQQAELGDPLAPDAALMRGDLIFWRGHVGIMLDAERLLHANAHAMQVACEPLSEVARRIESQGGGAMTARKRLRPQ